MSEEVPTGETSSLESTAEEARAFLDKLATAPLEEQNLSELVDKWADVINEFYGLNEASKCIRDITISAWTRICEVVARLGALHTVFEQPESGLSRLYVQLVGGLTSLTNCGADAAPICNALLDCGLVRLFAEHMRGPEMTAAREQSPNYLLDLAENYMALLTNVVRLPDFNSRLVTLAREVQLVATVKDYVPINDTMLRMVAYMLIGWVANEEENDIANPTVYDFRIMRQTLVRALQEENHTVSDCGLRAEEMLEAFANLVACADDNVSDVIGAHLPIILGAVLSGPLYSDSPKKVQPGEYTLEEKLLALRCCQTMCFTPEGRAAIFAIPRLAGAIAKYAKSDENNELKETASGCVWEIAATVDDPPAPPNTDEWKPGEGLDDAVVGEPAEKEALDAAVKELLEALTGSKQSAEKSRAIESAGECEISAEKLQTAAGMKVEKAGAAPFPQAAAAVQMAPQKGQVMLSYCWATKDLVKKVQQALVQMGINVWFDEEEMHGSLIDRMAEAVEGSQAIVLCYSQAYKNSGNCRGEAQYAYKCKKPIIPVRCQERYDADGWLGFIIGSMLYYDLSTADSFNQNLPGLLKEVARLMGSTSVEEKISKIAASTTAAAPQCAITQSTPAVAVTGPPEEYLKWDEADVQKWLENEQLTHLKDTFKQVGVNGKVLREIRRALDKEPKFLEHFMERPLELLRALRLTSSLRTLPLSQQ